MIHHEQTTKPPKNHPRLVPGTTPSPVGVAGLLAGPRLPGLELDGGEVSENGRSLLSHGRSGPRNAEGKGCGCGNLDLSWLRTCVDNYENMGKKNGELDS